MSLTVVTTASSFDLTTLARVKLELSISSTDTTKDTYLNTAIKEASSVIAHETGRTFAKQKYTEGLAGNNKNELMLKKFPLISITKVVENGTTLASTTYTIEDSDCGILYKEKGWLASASWGQYIEPFVVGQKHPYVITYEAGWILPSTSTASTATRTLPYDVEQACVTLVSAAYNGMGRDPLVKHDRTGDAEQTLFDVPYGVKVITGLPPAVYRVIEKYSVAL